MPSSPLPSPMNVRAAFCTCAASKDTGNCFRIFSMRSLAAMNRSFRGWSRLGFDVLVACSSTLTARVPSARNVSRSCKRSALTSMSSVSFLLPFVVAFSVASTKSKAASSIIGISVRSNDSCAAFSKESCCSFTAKRCRSPDAVRSVRSRRSKMLSAPVPRASRRSTRPRSGVVSGPLARLIRERAHERLASVV